ncbi:MAG: hypothetical protein ACUZ8O_13035 [Candidatus Anammoxibacter sp.]
MPQQVVGKTGILDTAGRIKVKVWFSLESVHKRRISLRRNAAKPQPKLSIVISFITNDY